MTTIPQQMFAGMVVERTKVVCDGCGASVYPEDFDVPLIEVGWLGIPYTSGWRHYCQDCHSTGPEHAWKYAVREPLPDPDTGDSREGGNR